MLALDALGMDEEALHLLSWAQGLRNEDGSYWTGWQYANEAHFPAERSGWTAAAVILAGDALTGFSAGAGIFRDVSAPIDPGPPIDPQCCGCTGSATAAAPGPRAR